MLLKLGSTRAPARIRLTLVISYLYNNNNNNNNNKSNTFLNSNNNNNLGKQILTIDYTISSTNRLIVTATVTVNGKVW